MEERPIDGCRVRELQVRGDERGSLIALEGGRDLPFEIARVYYIFGTKPGVSRGFHGHRKLRQLAICVAGSCTIVVDNGRSRLPIRLDRPDRALEIGPMIWREIHDLSDDCVLVMLASEPHQESDYIRDYGAFLELAGSPGA